LLPDAVAVRWCAAIGEDFHARYSALSRTYRYELINRPVRPAIAARYAGWFHGALDLPAMRDAAAVLVGEHDFSAFRSAECQAKSPVRAVHSLEVGRTGEKLAYVIRATAYLHHKVRNIVGTLVYVGKDRRPAQWVKEILDSRDRSRAAPTFAPEGLYLETVEYDRKWNLPA
jgi:tRNA pseudouridine38-40 synthase